MAKKSAWEIVLTQPAARVPDRAPKEMRGRLERGFEDLAKYPVRGNNIVHLTGQLNGLIRYRAGDWRIIYRLAKEKRLVEIVAILHRGDAY